MGEILEQIQNACIHQLNRYAFLSSLSHAYRRRTHCDEQDLDLKSAVTGGTDEHRDGLGIFLRDIWREQFFQLDALRCGSQSAISK